MPPDPFILAAPILLILASCGHAAHLVRKARIHALVTAKRAADNGDAESEKTARYAATTHRDTLIHLTFRTAMMLALAAGGAATLHDAVFVAAVPQYGELAVLLSFLALFHAVDLPFAFLKTFGTERRFGFNRSTLATTLTQRLALFYLDAVYSVALFLLLRCLYDAFPSYGWLLAAPALVLVVLIKHRFFPAAQGGLSRSMVPLADSPLKTRLAALADRAGIKVTQILVFNAGKHTAHTCAYVTGVGSGVRIVLFDSLLKELEEDEIEAVVAHEIAHHTHRHILRRILFIVASRMPAIALCWAIGGLPHLAQALGFTPGDAAHTPASILVALWFVFVIPLVHWTTPIQSALNRRQEYEADAGAARLIGDSDAMIRALTKIHAQNRIEETPHPQFSEFYANHPTGARRLEALRRR